MNNTETKRLKLALAKELPDNIETIFIGGLCTHGPDPDLYSFTWLDTQCSVTEREWDWIVRQCIGKLSPLAFKTFVAVLKDSNHLVPRNAQLMRWQQRAKAYFQAKGQAV